MAHLGSNGATIHTRWQSGSRVRGFPAWCDTAPLYTGRLGRINGGVVECGVSLALDKGEGVSQQGLPLSLSRGPRTC